MGADMSVKWTDNQNIILDLNNSDKNMLVSASSGSGKTTVMIERIITLILNRKVSIDNILVTTFTNAAALDMKSKLIRSLTQALSTSNEKSYLIEQLDLAESAKICTLHSFCSDLIRKYYYAVGVDPAFSIIEDIQAALKKAQALKKIFEEYLEKGDEIFLNLYDIFSRYRKTDTLAQYINKIYTFYRTLPKSADWLSSPPCPDIVEQYIQNYKDMADEYYISYAQKIKQQAQNLGYEPANEVADCVIDGVKTGEFVARFPALKRPKDIDTATECLIEKTKSFSQDARKFYGAFADKLTESDGYNTLLKNKLYELVGKFDSQYKALKQEDFELDYADLEHYAYDILSNHNINEEIKQKYAYVFVDEYQDINPMQEQIISMLDKSKLFMVGDIKQSIYRFRLCNPDIFIDKYKKYKSEGNKNNLAIDLNDNFRSVQSILDFNNELFSRLMTEKLGGVDYNNHARFNGNNPDLETEYPAVNIVLSQIPKSEKFEPSEVYSVKNHNNQLVITDAKAEADIIINEIAKIKKYGQIQKEQNGQKVTVSPDFSDIVILFRSLKNKSFEIIKEIAKVYPVNSNLETELLERIEILMLLDYIKVIDNSYQDIALAGALNQVFGNLDENELYKIREQYKSEEFFYDAVLKYSKNQNDLISDKLKAFFTNLENDRKYAACHSTKELIIYLVTKYRYEEYLAQYFENSDYEYVELLINLAEKYDTVVLFLSYIDNGIMSPDIEMPKQNSTQAIKIMTIHQSKGLEFPVVFICGLGRKFNHSKDEIMIDKIGLGLKNYDFKSRFISVSKDWSAIKLLNQKNETEEELRILYVALTRAKYHLVLTGTLPQKYTLSGLEPFEVLRGNSYLSWILAVLGRDKNNPLFDIGQTELINILSCYNISILQAIEPVNYKSNQPPIMSMIDIDLCEKIKQNFSMVYVPDGLNAKYTVTELNNRTDTEAYSIDWTNIEKSSGGAERGNAYHCVMKYIDINVNTIDQVISEIQRLQNSNLLSEEYKKLVDPQKILNALNSKTLLLARKNNFYRERDFLFYVDSKELGISGEQKVLVQGIIDLLIFTDSGMIVVDYKTTKGSSSYLKELYNNQLNIYSKACEKILDEKVVNKVIYSFEQDLEIYLD
jgi:ATP-dependent helicase/nuclease subunit A